MGDRIRVEGRVVDIDKRPVVGAQVEIWQADANGRYAHPCDAKSEGALASFRGHGRQRTDAQGRFLFISIKPGAYSTESGRVRAPHIHFEVTGASERFLTQMFFEGEALNATDPQLGKSSRPNALLGRWHTGDRSLVSDALPTIRWTIVMTRG
jgi:protocatechuate 3,4-dioxygenase beta subunit